VSRAAAVLAFTLLTTGLLPLDASAYRVEPGSDANRIQLQIDDRAGRMAGPLEVRASASVDWIEIQSAGAREGTVREIEVRFSVREAAIGSIGFIEILTRAASGLEVTRTIPLEAALDVEEQQRSFAIDECCLDPSGLDPHDPSAATPALLGNSPNPVVSLTHVVFDLGPAGGAACLKLYDVHGRLLRTIQTPPLSSGLHRITWDGRDEQGRDLPSGVYLYTMESGDWTATRKLQLLR
jgi:hypothetical protein